MARIPWGASRESPDRRLRQHARLAVQGEKREHVCAFPRVLGEEAGIVVAPRLVGPSSPVADRLDRALSLPLDEALWIERNFQQIMHPQPTPDEREFWRAVVDCRRLH